MKTGKKWIYALFAVSLLAQSIPVYAEENEKTYKEIMTYESTNPDEKKTFDEYVTKDGRKYKLTDVQYKPVRKKEKEMVSFVETSEPVLKNDSYGFLNRMTKEGILYTLREVREQEAEPYEQEVYSYTDYDYPVTDASAPKQKHVTVMNEKTGQEENVDCSFLGVEQTDRRTWVDSDIDITVQGYDSNSILWQGMEIPNDMGNTPLKGYDTELLRSVGLDGSTGRILRTYWTSEAYTDASGTVCRNARADIQKNVPIYRAEYAGKLETPMVIKQAVYEGKKEGESDTAYTITATAVYEESSVLPYILTGVGILLAAAVVVGILMIIKKKKEKKDGKS